jgi:LPXTG-motif cell wall-anchored protein
MLDCPLHIFLCRHSKMDYCMRTLSRAGVLAVASSAALFVAPVAHANGDNGTVKIHDAKTGQEVRGNEPHVCTFYLDAFKFDGRQDVTWHIDVWAPKGVKGDQVKSGDITLDAHGNGRTEDVSLPDGHYKLFWDFDGKHGKPKHKVFWTDCKDSQGGGTTSSGSTGSGSSSGSSGSSGSTGSSGSAGSTGSGSSSGSSGSGSTSGSPSAAPSDTGEASASSGSPSGAAAAPSSSPSAQGGAEGNLAETGSSAPVGLLSGAAAALVAAGGFLVVLRRRKAGQR